MLKAVEHCHANNIIHRDVKMENFLASTNLDNFDSLKVKLSDFGLACHYKPEQPPSQKCGSVLAVAPEILTREYYGKQVDMWSLGVILHELLSSQLPFYAEDNKKYMENIVRQKLTLDDERWSAVSDDAKDLVRCLLCKNPEKRLDATETLRHRWLSGLETVDMNSKSHVKRIELSLSAETVVEDDRGSFGSIMTE